MKYSFKTKWLDDEQMFQVQLIGDGEVLETEKFYVQIDAAEYICDTMSELQIAGEEWTLSY